MMNMSHAPDIYLFGIGATLFIAGLLIGVAGERLNRALPRKRRRR